MSVTPPLVYCDHGYCESEHCRTCEIMGVCKSCENHHDWVDDPAGHDAKRCTKCGAFYSNARLAQARYGGWIEKCAQRAPGTGATRPPTFRGREQGC